MKKNFIYVFFLLLAAAFGAGSVRANEGLQTANTPDAVVRELYRVHDNGNGALLDRKSRSQLLRFFDRRLFDLLWKELTSNSDEVGNLDFDPFYNAQDTQITGFTVGRPSTAGSKSSVVVNFHNAGRRERLTYKLTRVGKYWQIENIVYSDASTLVKILSAPLN